MVREVEESKPGDKQINLKRKSSNIAPFFASGLNCDDLIGRMIYEE